MSAQRPIERDFHHRWSALRPPLRPPRSVVEAMRPLIAGGGISLQLGVTPEIACLATSGIAVDWNPDMIRIAWPGDGAGRHAVVADWMALPVADRSVDRMFGDGSLTMLSWPDGYRKVFAEAARAMKPGGRLVLRCFAAHDGPEPVEAVVADAIAGRISDFAAFKLRFNMAAFCSSGASPNSGDHIHRLFARHCPDRMALAAATGWATEEIGSIDAYRGRNAPLSYPARRDIATLLPASVDRRFIETEGYPLAERCPLLVVDFG